MMDLSQQAQLGAKLIGDPICTCGARLSAHCRSGVLHTDHKEDARMVPNDRRTGNHVCHTRHCLAPLCSCVDFQEAK